MSLRILTLALAITAVYSSPTPISEQEVTAGPQPDVAEPATLNPEEELEIAAADSDTIILPDDFEKVDNNWGTYYNLNNAKFKKIFFNVFPQFKAEDTKYPPLSKCTGTQSALYGRYYQDGNDPTEYILSYFCIDSKTYEHLKVKIDDIDSAHGEYQAFYSSLKDLGIPDAGKYPEDPTEAGEDAVPEIEKLFNEVKDQIDADLHENYLCENSTLETFLNLFSKEENNHYYYKFPVACSIDSLNDQFTSVEVAKDMLTAKVDYVGADGPASNVNYLKYEAEEESELQSGSSVVATSVSIVLIAAFVKML